MLNGLQAQILEAGVFLNGKNLEFFMDLGRHAEAEVFDI
jgi:hypothetical protein